MRHIALIFVILLIGAHCTSISDKYPALKQRKSLLSLMTAVESKLSTKTPVHEIVKLVIDYTNSVQEEQLNQNNLFQKQTKECDDEISFRENEINSATDATNKAQFALDACNTQHNRADSDLKNVNNQMAETQNYLNQLIITRDQEAEAFQKATESYSFNAQAADEAIEILQQIWSGEATFIQLAKHANKMLMHAIQIRKVHKLTPVMSSLAQLATKKLVADEILINNVMSLLRDFRNAIENDYRTLEASEQSSIELYNTNRARTEDFLASLKEAKNSLEVELSKLNQCIHNQSAILSTAQAKLLRNTQLLDSANNMCASFQREYESATLNRSQELELIEIIKQKLEARYGQVSDFIKKRSVEDTFDSYSNKSQYSSEVYQGDTNEDYEPTALY